AGVWRQIFQVVGIADRLPEAAQIFAARRARPDMGQLGVLGGHVAMEVAAIPRLQKRSPRRRNDTPPRCSVLNVCCWVLPILRELERASLKNVMDPGSR